MIVEKNNFFIKKVFFILEPFGDLQELKNKYDYIAIITDREISDKKDFELRKKKTSIIDIFPDKDRIFKNFNDTTRNEVNRTYKNKDLSFFQTKFGENFFKDCYIVYKKHEISQGRLPDRIGNFKEFIFFGASFKGEVLACSAVYKAKSVLRIKNFSSLRKNKSDKEIIKIISAASRRIIWEICLFASEHGFGGVDLAYVNLQDPAKAGIDRFKLGFGGRITDDYTYVYKNKKVIFLEKIWKIFLFLKAKIMRIK
ncbi:MAG: hypothetical protein PHO91_00120 [Patescibacteria group bacterium]|nr:hypothetical protein [Patescibacteria group bacterium]